MDPESPEADPAPAPAPVETPPADPLASPPADPPAKPALRLVEVDAEPDEPAEEIGFRAILAVTAAAVAVGIGIAFLKRRASTRSRSLEHSDNSFDR